MYRSRVKKSKCGYCGDVGRQPEEALCRCSRWKTEISARCMDGTNDSSGVDDDSMHNDAGCSKSKKSKAEHEIPVGKDASEEEASRVEMNATNKVTNENDKLDAILSEIKSLNLKIPDTMTQDITVASKLRNESVDKSKKEREDIRDDDERLVLYKTLEQLCKDIDGLEYISEEKCLVCSYCVTTLSKGGVRTLQGDLFTTWCTRKSSRQRIFWQGSFEI